MTAPALGGLAFGWPWMLAGLVLVPLVVRWYRRQLAARAARRAQLAALGLVAPGPAGAGWRRRLPPVLLLVALALLVTAAARPAAVVPEPRRDGTLVLAVDVSGSMAAADSGDPAAPTRLDAAKATARTLAERAPAQVRVAVVAVGGRGLVTQEATTDRAAALAAIERLRPSGATSLGSGMQAALSAVVGRPVQADAPAGGIDPQGQDLGYHPSGTVVLFSDGENTADPDPLDVADLASTTGVRIYAVGMGSPRGMVLSIDGFQVATSLDEPLLREIATRTDGSYLPAGDQQGLAAVEDAIDLRWTVRTEHIEITGLVAAAAGLLIAAAVAASLAWTGRAV